MKAFLSLIILISMLPLQVLADCEMNAQSESSSCHSEMPKKHMKHVGHSSHKASNLKSEKVCGFCESGLCKLFSLPKIFQRDISESAIQQTCDLNPIHYLPFEIFQNVIDDRGPPDKPNNKFEKFFLSYHSWQSYYSVYII